MVDFDISTGVKSLIEGIRHQRRMTHSGIVLVASGILDRRLECALKRVMKPMSKKVNERLFESVGGPLSTFASKIVMARALGIVTNEIYDELEKIRSIRNHFSHSSKILTFESAEIAPKLLALVKPSETKKNPSELFVACVRAIDEFLEASLDEPQE